MLAVGDDVDVGVAAGDRVLFSKYSSSGGWLAGNMGTVEVVSHLHAVGARVPGDRPCACTGRGWQAGRPPHEAGVHAKLHTRTRPEQC